MDNIEKFKSQCIILRHKKSGASTKDAASILLEEEGSIIKSLLLKSGDRFFGVIIGGDKKLDIQKIKKYFNVSKISFANQKEVEEFTGFKIGGITPYAFFGKCNVVIDKDLLGKPYIIGSGGNEFTGIKFNPKDLFLLYRDVEKITK